MSGMSGGNRAVEPPASAPGRKPRSTRRVTVASAIVLAAALLAGGVGIAVAAGSGGTHDARVGLGLTCQFPSGSYQVGADVAATFPSAGTVGQPIQVTSLQVTLRLPEAAVSYLRSHGASTVSASESLGVTEASAGTPVPVQWPAETSAASTLPAAGGLQITTVGSAAPVAASRPGTVVFTVTGLGLTLSPHTSAGAATRPAAIQVSCKPSGGDPRLASVAVTAVSPSASPSATPSAKPGAESTVKYPAHCADIPVIGPGTAVCGWITGYSDVKKLYGAAKLGPGLINLDFAYKAVFKPGELIESSQGELYWPGTEPYYKGHEQLPPVTATFLTFKFVPVTATLVLIEHGPIKIVSESGITAPPYPITVTATTTVSIHVSDVTVNGQPLDVGNGCRTAKPTPLKLVGHGFNTIPPSGYTVPTGGPLAGTVTIPAFVHCGVTENLDPLLTGTISGHDNYVKMTQSKLCGPSQPKAWTCPPPVRQPIR